eukprot:XP_001704804.1 Hypothetical protein GL50803_38651 [Giardia lamblia ATCC 50803]
MLHREIQEPIYKHRCKKPANLLFSQPHGNPVPHVDVRIPVLTQHRSGLGPYDSSPIEAEDLVLRGQIEHGRKNARSAMVENGDENAILMEGLCRYVYNRSPNIQTIVQSKEPIDI